MKNPVLDDIMRYAKGKLMDKYGYCGVAANEDEAYLNSGVSGKQIKITIKQEES